MAKADAVRIVGTIAAVAVLFIPGVNVIVLAALSAAITIGTNALANSLMPSLASRDRTGMIRTAITTRKLHFGEMVLGGVLTFFETTDSGHFHHMIITLGDAPAAPWSGIDIVWLDDTPIFLEELDGGGNVTSGEFAGEVRIKIHLGGPNQSADSDLISEISRLDSNFRGRGVAYIYARLNWTSDLFPNGLPKIRVWARTNTVMDTRDSVRRYTTNAALILREYLTEPEVGLGYDAADLDDTQTDSAANTCDEIVDAKPLGHAVVQVDTANDELDVATAGSGAPVRLETGDRVEIFTDGSTPSGLTTGTSYYVIVERLIGANYDDDNESIIALDAGDYTDEAAIAISAGDVDRNHNDVGNIHATVKFATTYANALARTAISISTSGSGQHLVIKTGEPRYAAAGVVDSDHPPQGVINEMLSAMAGRLVWTGGVFQIRPGAWITPVTQTFDESDLWGPLVVRTKHSRNGRFNSVRGVLVTQISVGETTDYPPLIDATYVTADGGTEIWSVKDLPWTSRIATAQRLIKIDLARHRREIRVDYPTGPQGFRAMPGSIVKITNARRSWTNKTFEVLEQSDFELASEGDAPSLQGVRMMLAELDSTAFDFTASSDETIKPPQAVLRGGSPFEIDPPTDLILTSGDGVLFLKSDGTVVSRIKVEWTEVGVFADRTEVQFKPGASIEWETVGLVHTGQTTVFIWDVEDDISYDVRVRSISGLGVLSDWLTGSHTVEGKSVPPPDVTTFNVTRMADGTRRFVWTATAPSDVTSGGGFKLKFVAGGGGVWAGMSELHTGLLIASPYETNDLSAGSYTFGLKMVDSSGNESDNAAIIEATLGDPRLREVLITRDERALDWPGTLVDCFVNYENILESEGSQTWADLPGAWSGLPDTWLSIVNSKSPITYTTPTIDLGSDVTFTPIVSVDPSANATVTMKVGTDSDGAPVGSFVALATVTMRYIQIKASEASTDPFIQSLVTLLDSDTQIEGYEDVDTSAVTAGRFETIAVGHFKLATRGSTGTITSATIRAFQNAGSGWTWDLLSKSTTITGDSEPAAEFKIYKDGTLTDATIDAEIKGPKK